MVKCIQCGAECGGWCYSCSNHPEKPFWVFPDGRVTFDKKEVLGI